ncbi:DnaD domain protein [Lentibacillus sp. CBA3610]|nr:DnaD domain protein [Lentibacillus sp. CBA3610]
MSNNLDVFLLNWREICLVRQNGGWCRDGRSCKRVHIEGMIMMNYIKEINAFYDCVERNPLSASAVTLWHALMHINNKAMWIDSFTVAAPVLRLKSGLTDSSFKRARTELKDKGYIDYESRGNGQAPVYRMAGLVQSGGYSVEDRANGGRGDAIRGHEGGGQPPGWSVEKQWPEQDVSAEHRPDQNAADGTGRRVAHLPDQHTNRGADHLMDRGMDYVADHHMNRGANHLKDQGTDYISGHLTDRYADRVTAPLVKQNKDKRKPNDTKQNNATDATADAFVFYQENFGVVSPFVADALQHWVQDVGEELVLDAMKRALERGKSNWGYVRGILQAWAKKGITTVEAARAEEAEFRRRQEQRRERGSYVTGKVEVVPEWFREQKRQAKQNREREKAARESRDLEAEREEVERLLAEFRSG